MFVWTLLVLGALRESILCPVFDLDALTHVDPDSGALLYPAILHRKSRYPNIGANSCTYHGFLDFVPLFLRTWTLGTVPSWVNTRDGKPLHVLRAKCFLHHDV